MNCWVGQNFKTSLQIHPGTSPGETATTGPQRIERVEQRGNGSGEGDTDTTRSKKHLNNQLMWLNISWIKHKMRWWA